MTAAAQFRVESPGSIIAAVPAVLGYVPEESLVLVTVTGNRLGVMMRVDLDAIESEPSLRDPMDQMATSAARNSATAVFGVIVTAGPARTESHLRIMAALDEAMENHGVTLISCFTVDKIARGGRWYCTDGCGHSGQVDDPESSALKMAAMAAGRRQYSTRAELVASVSPSSVIEMEGYTVVDTLPLRDRAGMALDYVLTDQDDLRPLDMATMGVLLADPGVRDIMFALTLTRRAERAEALWHTLSRRLPAPYRVTALVMLAFSAYCRSDGPLAGIALEAALEVDASHRMAGMLDTALQSGMSPAMVRSLAKTGFKIAADAGVRMPEEVPAS